MSEEKIRISKDDLKSNHVEEILEQQAALSGDVDYLHRKDPPKTKLLLSSWFYLLIAGFVGALLAWMIIEPHFDDVFRVTGVIGEVKAGETIPGLNVKAYLITINGVNVYATDENTIVKGTDQEKHEIKTISDLKPGQYAYAAIQDGVGDNSGLAVGIQVSPTPFAAFSDKSLKDQSNEKNLWSLFIFPLLGALIGLFIGCADGLLSRTWMKAVKAGLIGMLIGAVGGVISMLIAGFFYGIVGFFTEGAGMDPFKNTGAFLIQVVRRTVAWALLGMTMGLGQGVALKSKKLLLNGFIGGVIGALLGGLLFDPIDVLILSKGVMDPFRSADVSRMVGFTLTGAFVGLMIGIVEQISKDAWLIMTQGPITGKQFIIYKEITILGSSPNCEIYLFKDPEIDPEHAMIVKIHDGYVIKDNNSSTGLYVNNKKVRESKLRNGDKVQLGKTVFSFSEKERSK
ncbi:MAG: FHA domain-containing protein [Firmicutes bacterium]|nr:FHA domain-containing protein [Bacillota bacterium]